MSAALRVIGMGNPWRGDDGVGPWVAAQLRAAAPPGVQIVTDLADGLAVLDAWRDAERVWIVDALRGSGAPGSVQRYDALAQDLPAGTGCSSHAFGLGEAVALGRTLGQLPRWLCVIGIEGRQFGLGAGLSAEVERAAQAVATDLRCELEQVALLQEER